MTYSYLTENGKWLQPQKVKSFAKGEKETYPNYPDNQTTAKLALEIFEKSATRFRVYPYTTALPNKLKVQYYKNSWYEINDLNYTLELSSNQAIEKTLNSNFVLSKEKTMILVNNNGSVFLRQFTINDNFGVSAGNFETGGFGSFYISSIVLGNISTKELGVDLRLVFNRDGDFIFRNDGHQFLLRQTSLGESVKSLDNLNQTIYLPTNPKRESILLTTTVIDELVSKLYIDGLNTFLSIDTQKAREIYHNLNFVNTTKLARPFYETSHLDFSGAHGLYFKELFFHILFLIADHLNAEGKYKEADYWYRKIFDPTGKVESDMTESNDRFWKFLMFRNQEILKLLQTLTDPAAISAYENDPFNPHAIARLREIAYMKCIVMKYVDNLIDWGDSLFRRDTWEANSEALMLYMLASDILGERPQKLGKCSSAIETNNCGCANPVTYSRLMETANLPPFIYYVENLVPISHTLVGSNNTVSDNGLTGSVVIGYEDISQNTVNNNIGTRDLTGTQEALIIPDSFVSQLGQQIYLRTEKNLVFCIPNNEKMLTYWDTIGDRLFKIRHCMNIDGVKRSLDLFAPPIDPALLVMARANGLSLDDILGSLYAPTPAYRFTYLVEKARAFAGTVQGFGGALLSALEKKDNEYLLILRSTHEQNLLKMTKEIKKKAIEEARANLQSTVEGLTNTINRVAQYAAWIEENLNGWERTQQISLHTSSVIKGSEIILSTLDSILKLFPDVGAPTAMKFGGTQLSGSVSAAALALKGLGEVSAILSSSAGLEASFQRRKNQWEFDKKTAEQELKQVQQQIAAATIRLAIAEKDLEIHEKQIEQAEEVHDFYKNKFTGLGLYNYMANTLSKLHRTAYNAAVDMANQAEAAFSFETDKNDFKGKLGTWDASRAGLLAGEDLSLQLQSMEAAYLKWHVRQMEIRQSFSMLMIDPEALQALRKNGRCTFKIPECFFDLQYPGHYHRRIVSLGITLPCVVGPYTNVAATLTMTKGSLRTTASVSPLSANGYIYKGSSMVATSSANNDGGQFDLNFRDERYLPFEGAGAVDSEWVLELPTAFKSFDYNTISDVLFHLSYRSKYDGAFKSTIETSLADKAGDLKRLIILKEEYPDAWYELTKPTPVTSIDIQLTAQHFPYFAQKTGKVASVSIGALSPNEPDDLNCLVTITQTNKGDGQMLVTYSI